MIAAAKSEKPESVFAEDWDEVRWGGCGLLRTEFLPRLVAVNSRDALWFSRETEFKPWSISRNA